MEHRHEGQDGILLGDRVGVDHHVVEAVQVQRPVIVEDPLRVPRGAGRVAHEGRRPLVEGRPLQVRGRPLEELLVVVDGRPRRLAELLPGRLLRDGGPPHDHVGLDGLDPIGEGQPPVDEVLVDQDDPVPRMVDDVGELLGEEADVQGVTDGADAGDREVGLEVAVMVPGEGPDPVPLVHAELAEAVRETAGPFGGLPVGVPVDPVREVGHPRHDLPVRIEPLGPLEEMGQQQRRVHHQPVHADPPQSAVSFIV